MAVRRVDYSTFPTVIKGKWPGEPNRRPFYERAERETDEVREQFEHELDISYGPHFRHRLDFYFPKKPLEKRPLVVFVHGGGFEEGDPALMGFAGRTFLEDGWFFASMGYPMMPDGRHFPDTIDDVADGLAWMYAHAVARGANPDHLLLAGNSAGAMISSHLGTRMAWLAKRGLPEDLIKAMILVSGIYDFRTGGRYFLLSDEVREPASALANVERAPRSTLIAAGNQEVTSAVNSQSEELRQRLEDVGGDARFFPLEGTNRDTIFLLADRGHPLGKAALELAEVV